MSVGTGCDGVVQTIQNCGPADHFRASGQGDSSGVFTVGIVVFPLLPGAGNRRGDFRDIFLYGGYNSRIVEDDRENALRRRNRYVARQATEFQP